MSIQSHKEFLAVQRQHEKIMEHICAYILFVYENELKEEGDYEDLSEGVLDILIKQR